MKKIDPKATALPIIDMQTDVVHPRGGWAAAGSPACAERQNAVAPIKAIAERARRRRGLNPHGLTTSCGFAAGTTICGG